jgi:Mrp family chromosome partitioning ATPase
MNNLEESFRILRASLEVKFSGSAVFTVTSADHNDGAGYVAAGLARAFAEAGESALLVSASREEASSAHALAQSSRGESTPLGATVQDAEFPTLQIVAPSKLNEAPASRNLKETLSEMREKFRVIVVAVDPLHGSASSFEYARESDGILLAVRLGRSPQSADQELLRALNACGTETIGVVPTRNGARAKALVSKKPAAVAEYGVTPLRKRREAKVAS